MVPPDATVANKIWYGTVNCAVNKPLKLEVSPVVTFRVIPATENEALEPPPFTFCKLNGGRPVGSAALTKAAFCGVQVWPGAGGDAKQPAGESTPRKIIFRSNAILGALGNTMKFGKVNPPPAGVVAWLRL